MKDEIKEILFLLHNDRLTESGKRKLEDYITNLQERNVRLNNIINELEAMFDGDLDGFFTINEKGSCNEIIEVIQNYKDKLKELKEGK